MSQGIGARNIENDDLTCPITLELFHDPVIAGDGRVYEREAITRWILEHGTSPFTREPLQINDLQADQYLRRLARRRRNSTVSFNARNDSVILPPLRRVPENTRQIAAEQAVPEIRIYPHSDKGCAPFIYCGISLIVIVTLITIGIMYGTKSPYSPSTSPKPQIILAYINSLTNNSSVFTRLHRMNDQYYYQVIPVVVSTNGFYIFKSVGQMAMCGYLYTQYFNATDPGNNLLIYDDGSTSSLLFYFYVSLQSGNYILVATTYLINVTGSYSIVVSGLANVMFQ